MNKKKKRKRKSNWTPPRNYTDFFSPEADQEFKRKHPIGYPALVMLGMVVLLLPACLFCVLVDGTKSGWIALVHPQTYFFAAAGGKIRRKPADDL